MRLLQPRYFDAFHCIGSDCEDTCCVGWIVNVDKSTYDKYQACSDPECGPSLHTLVTINEKRTGDDDYAKIVLSGSACPFLSEGWCSIQQRLGEGYLSNICATYPRVMNRVDEALCRSLDLSCPEAARVVLLDPKPIEFEEKEYTDDSIRIGNSPSLDTSGLRESPQTYRLFRDVQRRAISILQNRSYPIWKRLLMLGRLCEKVDEIGQQDWDAAPPCAADPMVQLEVVLEMIVGRIVSDANPPRFLECYKEFMGAVQWTSQSTMDQIAALYAEAYSRHYVSFMSRHEHMLEHYLVSYAYRTLFPFGLPERNRRLHNDRVPSPITAQYMLMIAYYAITRTLLIGMAGYHGPAFGAGHVIKLVQSCTKTFEPSATYPGRIIGMLADRAMTTPASLSVLTRTE